MEAGLSVLPEVAEPAVKGAARAVARGRFPVIKATRAGQILRGAEAYNVAKRSDIFQAPTEATIRESFDTLRQAGISAPKDAIRAFGQQLPPNDRRLLGRELNRVDADLNGRYKALGLDQTSQIGQQVNTLLATQDTAELVKTLDIGQLQDLRSALRARRGQVSEPRVLDLLHNAQNAVDKALDDAIALAPAGVDVGAARRAYQQYKAAEEFTNLLLEKSTLPTGKGNLRTLNFRGLRDALEKDTGPTVQAVNQALERVPGARERLDALFQRLEKQYRQIELAGGEETAGVGRIPFIHGALRGMGEVLLSDAGIKRFEEAIHEGKGRITMPVLATAINAVRRELTGHFGESESSAVPPELVAPAGGPAIPAPPR